MWFTATQVKLLATIHEKQAKDAGRTHVPLPGMAELSEMTEEPRLTAWRQCRLGRSNLDFEDAVLLVRRDFPQHASSAPDAEDVRRFGSRQWLTMRRTLDSAQRRTIWPVLNNAPSVD
ncbi:MAG: hypothetical protein U1E63_17940 [Burkholderiales bacterium]